MHLHCQYIKHTKKEYFTIKGTLLLLCITKVDHFQWPSVTSICFCKSRDTFLFFLEEVKKCID